MQLELTEQDKTEKLGLLLGQSAMPGDVICLDGDLGAGKTTLAQAIARGLEVPAECYVTSPSFAILHEYEGRLAMYHMDFYRLHDEADIIDLGFEEYFYRDGVTVIEWAKRAESVLPQERLSLQMELHPDGRRTATVTASATLADRLHRLAREMSNCT